MPRARTLFAAGLIGVAAVLTVSSLVEDRGTAGTAIEAPPPPPLPTTVLRAADGHVEIRASGLSRPISDLVDLGDALFSGRIEARDDAIVVRGVVSDTGNWEKALAEFESGLATTTRMDLDLTFIDTTLPRQSLCQRMFSEIADTDIEFRFSGSTLRTASHAALDRFVGLMTNCRAGRLRVVGHTDASGDESYNKLLSVDRARAVADYLQARGVDGGRIVVAGRGSAEPRADNRTPRGRARNRRIEFEWISAD